MFLRYCPSSIRCNSHGNCGTILWNCNALRRYTESWFSSGLLHYNLSNLRTIAKYLQSTVNFHCNCIFWERDNNTESKFSVSTWVSINSRTIVRCDASSRILRRYYDCWEINTCVFFVTIRGVLWLGLTTIILSLSTY